MCIRDRFATILPRVAKKVRADAALDELFTEIARRGLYSHPGQMATALNLA